MADNSKPTRIRQLLSSFVHRENQSDTSGSVKLNYPQPSTSNKDSQNSSIGISLPRDKKAYFQRISTYSQSTWFAKPIWLSPLHCARYGWQNVEKDILQCVSCKAFFNGKLPESNEPDVYEACCGRLKEGLITNHHNVCPWGTCPTPEDFGAIEIPKRQTALQEYEDRTKPLVTLKKNLPRLDKELEISDLYQQKLSSLIQNCGDLSSDELEVLKVACTLALLGWHKKETSYCNALHCKYCCREIGLWNFESLSSENHSEETIVISVNQEKKSDCDKADPEEKHIATPTEDNRDSNPLRETESNGQLGSTGTKRDSSENEDSSEPAKKKMKNSIRHGFNPIQEHKLWCPWINTQISSKKDSIQENSHQSPSTPKSQVISHSTEKLQSLPSWKGLLYTLLPDLSPAKGLFGIVKTTPPHEGIRCIRQVFKGWTSPTATLQGSKSATKL